MAATGRRLRVCLVSAAYHPYPSGISEHVSHLAGALVDLGLDVQVLTTRFAGQCDDSREPAPVVRIGRARCVPLNGSYATMPVGRALPRQVSAFFAGNTFDVVHCHGVFWPEIAYWAIRASRALHVVSFLSAGFRTTSLGAGLHRRVFARHLSRIDGRVALSERARVTYAPYVPGDCRIIPSGVDLVRFRPDAPPRPVRDRQWPRVLFVGRLDRRKGLEVLLEAMPALLVRVPRARLVVVGSGPGQARARARARALGIEERVAFEGRVERDALPGYYAGADAYCSPALGGESFGIVLLEAMASGTPVVASDIPGYDETIGADGLRVPPRQPRALAEALARVLSDVRLAERLRAAGLVKARDHAWPRIAARTAAFYEELLSGTSDGGAS